MKTPRKLIQTSECKSMLRPVKELWEGKFWAHATWYTPKMLMILAPSMPT